MTREILEGLAIERIWVVEATYGPDAAERRPAVRAEHLTRIDKLRREGIVIDAGGYPDMSMSLILLRTATEEQALDLMRADVYFRTGVWTAFRVRALGRVVRLDELPQD